MTQHSGMRQNVGGDERSAIGAILVVLDVLSDQLADISLDVRTSVEGVCSGFQGMGLRAKTALSTAADALDSSCGGGGLQAFVHRVRLSLDVLLRRIESKQEFSSLMMMEVDEVNEQVHLINLLSEKFVEISDNARRLVDESHKEAAEDILEDVTDKLAVISRAGMEAGRAIRLIASGIGRTMQTRASRVKAKYDEDDEAARQSDQTITNILDQLSKTYEKMSSSLSKTATTSRQLNMDIGQAVMSMQFQDRVDQRISHLEETIAELSHDLRKFRSPEDPCADSLVTYWLQKLSEKSTMAAERTLAGSQQPGAPLGDADDESVELF